MERRRRGTWLALAGVALLVVTLAVGFLTAPSLAVEGDRNSDRVTLVGSQSTEGGWHEGGAVMYFEDETEVWREDSAINYFDADVLDDGRVLAGFSHGGYETGCDPYEPPCHKTGYRIIDPDATAGPRVVEEWSSPVRTAANSEVHDADLLDTGEVLLTDMDRERLLTVRDGEVTWQWNASELYTPPPDPTQEDWLHMNDVVAINDTYYLASVRNANQLVVVERGEGAVEIINRDDGGHDEECAALTPDENGDVRCGDPAVLNKQHNPQWLDDGAVLVGDSDNNRAVELHENETTGEWEPTWAVGEAAGVDLHWPRDADRLANGNTLITDTFNSRVVEVTPNRTTVWTAQLYNLPYEADRLPEGERVGAARYTAGGEIVESRGDIPVLTTLTEAMKGEFPVVPFWFSELHLALGIVALLLVLAGGVEHAIALYAAWNAGTAAGDG